METKAPALNVVVGLFTLTYLVLFIGAALAFQAAGRTPGSSFNLVVILISVVVASRWFARKAHRTFTTNEYFVVASSCVAIDAVLQTLFSAPHMGRDLFTSDGLEGLALVVAYHAPVILLGMSAWVMRRYVPASNP